MTDESSLCIEGKGESEIKKRMIEKLRKREKLKEEEARRKERWKEEEKKERIGYKRGVKKREFEERTGKNYWDQVKVK